MQVPALSKFYDLAKEDARINARHISVFMALFECWNQNDFQNPILITRHLVMAPAKINGLATYHKCMRDLHALGYIRYEPSFDPRRPSVVYLLADEN